MTNILSGTVEIIAGILYVLPIITLLWTANVGIIVGIVFMIKCMKRMNKQTAQKNNNEINQTTKDN